LFKFIFKGCCSIYIIINDHSNQLLINCVKYLCISLNATPFTMVKIKPLSVYALKVLFWLLLWLNASFTQAQKKPFSSHFNSKTNNYSEYNSDLAIDGRNHTIFIANHDGILVYNGEYWDRIDIKETPQSSEKLQIACVMYDQTSQKIYFGGNQCFGYLTPDNRRGYRPVLLSKLVKKEQLQLVNQIMTNAQSIFFKTRRRIFEIDKKTNRLLDIIPKERYQVTLLDNSFLLYNNKEVKTWDNISKNWGKVSYNNIIKKINPFRIDHISKNQLLLQKRNKAMQILNTTTGEVSTWNESLQKALAGRFIYNFEKQGDYFYISSQDLLLVVDAQGNILQKFTLNGNVVTAKIDVYGNIWAVIAEKGLYYFETVNGFSFLPTNFSAQGIIKVDSTLFLRSVDEVFILDKDTYQPKSILKLDAYIFHHFTHDDHLYLSTTKGTYKLNKGKEYSFSKVSKLGYWYYYVQFKDKCFVGHRSGVSIYQKTLTDWKHIYTKKMPAPTSYLFFEPSSKTLWASGYSSGFQKFTISDGLDKIIDHKTYTEDDGLGDLNIGTRLCWFKGKRYFYNPNGIYEYKNNKFEVWLNKDKLGIKGNAFFTFVTPVENQYIFVTSQSNANGKTGLITFDEQGKPTWNQASFKRLIRYETGQLTTDQGDVLMATSKGIIRYTPATKRNFDIKHSCIIHKVIIQDSTACYFSQANQKNSQEVIIDYRNNKITFEYALPYYEGGIKANEYAHRIIGFDDHWSAWTQEAKSKYTNLPEGTYTFEVKARNIYGSESQVTSFSFEVLPPWYRTGWAYAGYSVLGLLLILAIVRANSYRLRQQKKRLETEVERQVYEIREQKEEIAQQAEELKTSNEKLAELSDYRESLSHMLVHDAKQPLAPLVNSTDATTRKAAIQVLGMLENILEVQKFENNEVAIVPESLSTNDLITKVLGQVKDLADEKLITIKNSIPLDLTVQADVGYITRILSNLLGNAIKYIPTNSIIQLESEVLIQQKLLKVWVKDNGPGIPDAHKISIFEKFGRIDKKDQRSTGLGLAFCKLAIEAHEGEIGVLTHTEVQALNGKGAWFYFTIPLVKTHQESISPTYESSLITQEFTTQDQALIKPFIPQLKAIEYYDAGTIMILLQNRDWTGSPALEAWIDRIPFADNEEHYQKMIQMFE